MFNLSLTHLLFRLVALLVIVGFHGLAAAAIARLLGDRGPEHDHRLTVNPVAHLEVIGALGLLLYQIGWIKPVRLDPAALRGGRWGPVAVAAGAVLASLLLALVLWRLRMTIFVSTGMFVPGNFITALADMSVWFAIANVLPVPPLTGGYLLQAVAPALHRRIAERWIVPALLLAALIVTGMARQLLQPVHDMVAVALGFSS
jgi:Zn-dependent protease